MTRCVGILLAALHLQYVCIHPMAHLIHYIVSYPLSYGDYRVSYHIVAIATLRELYGPQWTVYEPGLDYFSIFPIYI